MHPICLVADIVKMYRQVIIADEDTNFQRLVWRRDPASEIEDYKLVRVTFGTASAPYLAVKVLQQLAHDEGEDLPEVAEKIKNDYYVDDLMTGCETVREGLKLYKEMNGILTKGGFELQKWTSNNEELLERITEESKEVEKNIDMKLDSVMKVLGLTWDRETDSFKYSVQLPSQENPITKRKVISTISQLFDPLGWVAPTVITAKIFIQKLWLSGIGWDDELPPNLIKEWLTYRSDLLQLSRFNMTRWVDTRATDSSMELHGFCDASSVAFAAVVYLRNVDADGVVHVNLITAKTKVAPIKQVSIPRLELCGAVLLSKLIKEVAEVLKIPNSQLHAWTDSTVVLAWLSSHPSRWKTFVGNRVSEIFSVMDKTQWSHVKSAHNPADMASRGVKPLELSENSLWKHGPAWLQNQLIEYPRSDSLDTNIEEKSIKTHVVTNSTGLHDLLWNKFSSLQKLVRVVAYCRRFLKQRQKLGPYLTSEEIGEALEVCIRQSQHQEFQEDIDELSKTGNVKKNSKLKTLNPFLDERKILRVGGRIQVAEIENNAKHPIIISKGHLKNLLIDDAHKKTLHGGPQLMLNHLRSTYWIMSAKNAVKAHVRKCVTCVRHAAVTKNQLMGQLPLCRVKSSRPFLHSGVDFAGPISIRVSKGRGHRSYKGYICLFICMATRAIHLEVVSDLTAQGFIAGFKRFVARRGHCSDIWSDNGSNFVGASKELQSLCAAEQSSVAVEIRAWLSNNNVTWHFIPPHAPNFGGLWEAAIKSTKHHLKRVIGNSTLTYEEMATVLTQIEACLNSRPMSQISNDPNDPVPLTPGHFLVGEPLVIVPERNYEQANLTSLRRWQMTQRMVQDFWRRWSKEYLTNFLQRYKWSRQTPEPNVGDIVLIKEDNLPPARWLLGKVTEKHRGLDGITRVVTLKCNNTLIKRPTSKLCILPVSD